MACYLGTLGITSSLRLLHFLFSSLCWWPLQWMLQNSDLSNSVVPLTHMSLLLFYFYICLFGIPILKRTFLSSCVPSLPPCSFSIAMDLGINFFLIQFLTTVIVLSLFDDGIFSELARESPLRLAAVSFWHDPVSASVLPRIINLSQAHPVLCRSQDLESSFSRIPWFLLACLLLCLSFWALWGGRAGKCVRVCVKLMSAFSIHITLDKWR